MIYNDDEVILIKKKWHEHGVCLLVFCPIMWCFI